MGDIERNDPIYSFDQPWAKRWYVVSVYNAAEDVLESLDIKVTNEAIIEFVKKVKESYEDWLSFMREAAALRSIESKEIREELSVIGLSDEQIENKVFEELESRYSQIDSDEDRSYPFLDILLLQDIN